MLLDMARTHVPVLAGELIDLTAPAAGDKVVDCTFGAGGHARLVADRIGAGGTLVCVDRDPAAQGRFEETAAEVACATRFLRMEYGDALELLREEGFAANLVYLDLGISSMQVDARERGFSYAEDAPLDMRMDDTTGLTAADVLNTYPVQELVRILKSYGEERFARRIAESIVRQREHEPFLRSARLVELIREAIPAPARRTGGNPAKRSFQALRIEVNDELSILRRALPAAIAAIGVGGRVVAMSYHSLEDRLVKHAFLEQSRSDLPPDLPFVPEGHEPQLRLVTRGAEQASPQEIAGNPRAASVRLRAVERVRTSTGAVA